jgi:hypothetical protein
MIVPELNPNHILINADVKATTSVVGILGHASHEEALQIAAFLFLELQAIKRDTDAVKGRVDNALGENDDL